MTVGACTGPDKLFANSLGHPPFVGQEQIRADHYIADLLRVMHIRDAGLYTHSQRVAAMAYQFAERCGVTDPQELLDIQRGALLHDIGKLYLSEPTLFETGPLNTDQWIEMKKHPIYAVDLLTPFEELQRIMDIPRFHHERWDGAGYPDGIAAEDIPWRVRLFSIIDVWDALLSERPYRPPWTVPDAMDHLSQESGSQFDPELVQSFLQWMTGKLNGNGKGPNRNVIDNRFQSAV